MHSISVHLISSGLFDEAKLFCPEILGERRRIFCASQQKPGATLVELLVDPPQMAGAWREVEGATRSGALIALLKQMMTQNPCRFLAIVQYERERHSRILVDRVMEGDCLHYFSERWLSWGDVPIFPGGPVSQSLVLFFEEQGGAVVFHRGDTFQVDYYGNRDLWGEISRVLYGEEPTE